MRAIYSGSIIISPQVANKFLRAKETTAHSSSDESTRTSSETSFLKYLSKREIEVLRLIGEGYDNNAISRRLFIAEQTVKNHVSVIYSKLNIHNRIQVMKLADSLKGYISSETNG